MKAKFAKLSLAIATAVLSFSGTLSADTTSIQVGTGYRQDSLTSIVRQRGSSNPRSKSNLHYRDVEIVLLGVKAKSTFGCCDSYVRADFDYGWVLDGKLRDKLTQKERDINTDTTICRNGYFEEGTFLDEYSRHDLSRNSFVWDLDIGFAYPIKCGCDNNWILSPAIGFAVNRQHFHGKHGADFNNIGSLGDRSSSSSSSSESSDSSSDNSNTRNRTSWWGPWFGFDFAYDSCDCWNLYGEFEVHIGRVRHSRGGHCGSETSENFKNTRSFVGPSIKVGSRYIVCENWFLDGSIYYSKFYSFNSCRDDVKWATANIRLDLGYSF